MEDFQVANDVGRALEQPMLAACDLHWLPTFDAYLDGRVGNERYLVSAQTVAARARHCRTAVSHAQETQRVRVPDPAVLHEVEPVADK
jgi:hypothetical protein